MKITFYQNCILSSRYNEVFWRDPTGNNNPLEEYLDTLTKYEQIIDSTYLPVPRGNFTIENPYKDGVDANLFNYIKVEYDEYENVRPFYAFIQNINLLYNQIVVTYLVDYWSSFSQYMHIRNSLLTNTNILAFNGMKRKEIEYYHYPVNYLSSVAPKIERFYRFKPDELVVYVIAKIQIYTLGSSGTVTNRKLFTCCIMQQPIDQSTQYFKCTNDTILEMIDIMITSSAGNNLILDKTNYNYEIIDLYVVPSSLFTISLLSTKFGEIKAKKTYDLWHITYSNFDGQFIKTNEHDLPLRDFKVQSIGTVKNQINIDIFGTHTNKKITTYIAVSNSSINFYLGLNGQFYDITEDFRFELPISVETADATQLKTLTRIFKTNLNATETANKIAQYGAEGIESFNPLKPISSAVSGTVSSTAGIATATTEGILKDQYINAKTYKSNSSTLSNDNVLLPCYYGICYFYFDNVDNEKEVKEAIALSGYKCAVEVDDILQVKPSNATFTNLKFAFVNLYGSFSQDIKEQLEDILVSGTRIYYTKEI